MRVRSKDKKNFVKVGVFISFLAFILMVIIISIGKETSLFESKITIRAHAPNVSNLKVGSYVELKGIRIGTVDKIEIITHDLVEIQMHILEKELKWINENSRISISTAGLVGDKFIEILSGTKEAKPFNPMIDILETENSDNLKVIMNKGETIASKTESILFKIDQILGQIKDQQLLIETLQSLNQSSKNMEKITSELKEAQLSQVMSSISNGMNHLSSSTISLQKILTRIEKGPGTLNSLIFDESVHDDLRSLLGGAQRNKTLKYFIRKSIENSQPDS